MKNFEERVNVLCATDKNNAPYCGIMLTSLFESNRDSKFRVFVFVDGCLSENNSRKYDRLARRYYADINLVPIDNQLLGEIPVNHQIGVDNHVWVTLPTYYRLLAADLLPQDVHKVLYLDCDIVVVGDVKPLWNVDLAGKAVAGVTDCDEEKNRERLGIPSYSTYINAGVAIYNLDYWRANHVSEAFFGFIRDNESKLLLMDQDVVNGALFDRKSLASERYNFQVSFFAKEFWNHYSLEVKEILLEENKHVAIVHYCGGIKPWDYRYYGSPYYAVWEKYRKTSLWKRNRIKKPCSTYLKFLVKKSLFSKPLKKKKQTVWAVLPENEFCFQ